MLPLMRRAVEDGIYEIEPIATPGKRHLDVQWGSRMLVLGVWLCSRRMVVLRKSVSVTMLRDMSFDECWLRKVLDVYGASKAFGTG